MTEKEKQSGSILVVDDEESLRNTFHFFLSRQGYDPVLTTATFDEALSVLQERSVDLIVSDIVLENSTGIDLLKQQIRMATDAELGLTQDDVKMRGHALECRINAENPERDFLPCPGRIFSNGNSSSRMDGSRTSSR